MNEYLWDLKAATVKLMKQRGYDIDEGELPFFDSPTPALFRQVEEFFGTPNEITDFLTLKKITTFRPTLTTFYEHPKGYSCLVYFVERKTEKFLTEDANTIRDLLIEFPTNFCIIVSYSQNGCQARLNEIEAKTREIQMHRQNPSQRLEKFIEKELHFQFFEDLDLFYNPLEHVYSPTIERLTSREIRSLKLIRQELPIILSTDPIVKRMGFLPNDIVRITTSNLIPGTLLESEVTYRWVRNPTERFLKMEKSLRK